MASEENPRSTTVTTRPSRQPRSPSLTSGRIALVVGVAGPAPAAHRDAFAGHGQPDDDLRQIRAVVLGVPVAAERVVAVSRVAFEVGGGGVEEQQVDLEVEQVGDGEEHRFLHLGLGVGVDQEVHRPIGLVLVHRLQPGDRDVAGGPLGGGQLEAGSMARLATSANSTRSTSVREPAPAQHRARGRGRRPAGCHSPSSSQAAPVGRGRHDLAAPSAGGQPAPRRPSASSPR